MVTKTLCFTFPSCFWSILLIIAWAWLSVRNFPCAHIHSKIVSKSENVVNGGSCGYGMIPFLTFHFISINNSIFLYVIGREQIAYFSSINEQLSYFQWLYFIELMYSYFLILVTGYRFLDVDSNLFDGQPSSFSETLEPKNPEKSYSADLLVHNQPTARRIFQELKSQ